MANAKYTEKVLWENFTVIISAVAKDRHRCISTMPILALFKPL